MALEQKALVEFGSANAFAELTKTSMNDTVTSTYGTNAAADLLARSTPVGYNDTIGYWGEWLAADPAILTVDIDGSTGGTWGLTVDGIVIANTVLADDATAALVQSTILAATGIVTTVDLTAGVYTITFGADTQVANVPVNTGDVTQLTGGSTPTAVATAGASTFGLSTVRGFAHPEPIQLSTTLQVHGETMVEGRLPYADIAATQESGDLPALIIELKRTPLGRGIIVEDLPNIH
jgi:hypothetical protein